MSEGPLIEAAMKRLAEARAEAGASVSAGPDADPDCRGSIGRRSYDEALAWRRAQLAAAMGTAPTSATAPVERRTHVRKPEVALGRREHEVDVLGRVVAPLPTVYHGFSLAELVGTGLVCAVASAAISWAIILTHAPALEVPSAAASGKALLVDRASVFSSPLTESVQPPAAVTPAPAPQPVPAAVEVAAAATSAEPTEVPAPQPMSLSGFDEAAARAAVEAWRAAWSAIDVDRYLATYAPDFVAEDGLSGAAWAESRRANFARKSRIDVRVSQLRLTPVDADHFEADFIQDYTAGNYRERGTRKTLVLRRTPDGWRISAERQQR